MLKKTSVSDDEAKTKQQLYPPTSQDYTEIWNGTYKNLFQEAYVKLSIYFCVLELPKLSH